MAMMTVEEAQLELTQVNVAISNLIAGKSVTQLRIGSGNFQREYKYWQPDTLLSELRDLRKELMAIIQGSIAETPTFNSFSTVPLIVRKEL